MPSAGVDPAAAAAAGPALPRFIGALGLPCSAVLGAAAEVQAVATAAAAAAALLDGCFGVAVGKGMICFLQQIAGSSLEW
jgi:hypothetical protein